MQLVVERAADGSGVLVAVMDTNDHSIRGVELTPEVAARIATVLANQSVGRRDKTERAEPVADGDSNTPRGEVVESGVQPYAGEVDAEFESRLGPLVAHDRLDGES